MAFIALGVTGGIGAYKAVEIARGLQKNGHEVVAVMSRSARRFVGPLTFEAITRRAVVTDQWKPGANADIEHISLASSIDLLLVAPATANTVGKFANGLADDFLSSLYLATRAPVMIAPAMNTQHVRAPGRRAKPGDAGGRAACISSIPAPAIWRAVGSAKAGWPSRKMSSPRSSVCCDLADRRLAGRRVLVTAGPTYENIDPVRFVGNRSSGRMGYAVAERSAQARRGRDPGQRANPSDAAGRRRAA